MLWLFIVCLSIFVRESICFIAVAYGGSGEGGIMNLLTCFFGILVGAMGVVYLIELDSVVYMRLFQLVSLNIIE